jgi:hypothetical protein
MAAEMSSRHGDDEFEVGLQHLIDGLRRQQHAATAHAATEGE